MKKTLIPESMHVTIVAMVVLFLYVVALIFPDNWWGLHYPAFLGGIGVLIIVVAVGLTLYGSKFSMWEDLKGKNIGGNRWLWTIALTIISGIFFSQMPIFNDVYGDALSIIPDPEFIVTEFDERNWGIMFSFDLTNLKLGTDTTVSIAVWLSYAREMELQEAFAIIGVVCGMGYVFFMLASFNRIAKDSMQRLLFALMVLGSPIVLNFCGHIEIYGPVLFLLSVFWYVLIRFVEKPSWILGIIVFLVCIMNMKFHVTGALTILIFALSALYLCLQSKGKSVGWKNFGLTTLGLFLIGGFSFYVLVTKSVFATRTYNADNLTDAIFLPIKAAEQAPLNRYNLFSWNHIFDYFNMAFLWSAVAIIIVVAALIFKRKAVNWNHPLVMTSGLAFIICFVVFFVLNPLLGMPTDFDLMSIPALALMVFAVSIITQMKANEGESRNYTSFLIGPAAGLFIIGLTGVFVNADEESEADRVITYAKYHYKTYWIGAITPLRNGIAMKQSEDQHKELKKALVELEPFSVKGNDIQYAALLNEMGRYYENVERDTTEAHRYYLRSESYDKTLLTNMYDLTRTYLAKGEYSEANDRVQNLIYNKYPSEGVALEMAMELSKQLEDKEALVEYAFLFLKSNPENATVIFDLTVDQFVKGEFDVAHRLVSGLVYYKYPNEVKSLRMAIHISLEAEEYEASKQFCVQLLKVKPRDDFIRKILHLLNTLEDKSVIKNNFRQS